MIAMTDPSVLCKNMILFRIMKKWIMNHFRSTNLYTYIFLSLSLSEFFMAHEICQIQISLYIYVHIHTHIYIYVYICVYIYMYTYIHTHIYIYTYIYIIQISYVHCMIVCPRPPGGSIRTSRRSSTSGWGHPSRAGLERAGLERRRWKKRRWRDLCVWKMFFLKWNSELIYI